LQAAVAGFQAASLVGEWHHVLAYIFIVLRSEDCQSHEHFILAA
jgi:hypothetical protein